MVLRLPCPFSPTSSEERKKAKESERRIALEFLEKIKEREEIVALARTDPKEYIRKIKSWGIERMERLRQEGWRKANER